MSTITADRGYLNYARGLGIVAVVFGHVNPGFGPSVGTFHMPLFFFIGGVLLVRARPWRDIARFVVIDMLLFAILMTLGYTLVSAALEPLGVRLRGFSDFGLNRFTTDILVNTAHHVQFALTAWFLVAYAGATIMSQVLVAMLPDRRIAISTVLISIVLLLIGILVFAAEFHANGKWYFNLASQVSVGTAFMLLGFAFRRSGWERYLDVTLLSVAGLFIFVTMVRTLNARDVGMVFSVYESGVVVAPLCALAGIIATLQLAMLMSRSTRVWGWMASIGKLSKHVMAHHLFLFTLFNLLGVAVGLMRIEEVTSVYSKFELPVTWPLYLVLGVAGSLAIGVALQIMQRKAAELIGVRRAWSGATSKTPSDTSLNASGPR